MIDALVMSGLMMGLVGGPHCVAMCGAACVGVARAAPGRPAVNLAQWHASRLLGYALLGAVAAGTVEGFAWLGANTVVIRPVWTMMHVAALGLGLWLLISARQPAFVDGWAQAIWRKTKPLMRAMGPKAPVVLGLGWALMPCGLLYSAVLVASLSASVWQGAAIMAAFALGSMVSLTVGPWLFIRYGMDRSGGWGMRLAGLALVAASAWAIWMGMTNPSGLWCA